MRDTDTSYRVKHAIGFGAMVLALIFAVFPMIWVVILALRPKLALFEPIWESPTELTFSNFSVLTRSDFPGALLNSFITAGTATILALILGTPAAFALAKSRMAGKFIASWLILLLRMAPPVGFAIPLFLLYINAGMIDTYGALIFAYMSLTLPFVVWSLWTSFSQIPNELIEASLMDGASIWQTLLLVVVPAAGPGLVAAGVLAFLIAWNDFFFALVITRSETMTAPVGVMEFISYADVNWGVIAVAAIALTLPVAPLIMLANRYIVQSLGGSVKQ